MKKKFLKDKMICVRVSKNTLGDVKTIMREFGLDSESEVVRFALREVARNYKQVMK